MRFFEYNPCNDKSPVGAVKQGSKVTYTLRIAKCIFPYDIYLVYREDKAMEEKSVLLTQNYADERYYYFSGTVEYKKAGLYWYYFKINEKNGSYCLQKGFGFNASGIDRVDYPYLQLVYNKDSHIHEDIHDGIIYQIFVDRFCSEGKVETRDPLVYRADWCGEVRREINNGVETNLECFGGNLKGIISKLDYLQSLNTKIIYLSPIFEANSNHKYDTADYSKIDSMFGDMDDLQKLINEAKKRGIRILLDGVFNHTGSDSIYFNRYGRYDTVGAYQSRDSKYSDWYHFSSFPDSYDSWWGINTLPDVKEVDSFIDYIAGEGGIVDKYMKMGILGFRLDVVDELGDPLLDAIVDRVKRVDPKGMVLGEVWEDASIKIAYSKRRRYFTSNQLDSVTNYPMKNALINYVKFGEMEDLVETLSYILDQYPVSVQNNLMNILDSHDTVRILSAFGNTQYTTSSTSREKYELSPMQRKKAIELLKQATILQYTIVGIPTVFYGDEVGVEGMKDPYSRVCFPWGKEDMDMLSWYKALGALRKNPVFNGGDFKFLNTKDKVLSYERTKGDDTVVVILNKSKVKYYINIEGDFVDYITNDTYSNVGSICVEPEKYMVLVKQNKKPNKTKK